MAAICSSLCITLICLMCCLGAAFGQKMDKGAIGFPESEENPNTSNKQNRVPVFLPSKCPVNELYYPGDQESDWICDCRPGYLYHPSTDNCWLAYQRGPCPAGQYLVLPRSSVIPVCERNPCVSDNLVMWQGKCERLGAMAPCGLHYPPSVIWVNSTTVEVNCVTLHVDNGLSTINRRDTIESLCPHGCKRSMNQQCIPDPRK